MQRAARAAEKELEKVREVERKAARRKEVLEKSLAAEACSYALICMCSLALTQSWR